MAGESAQRGAPDRRVITVVGLGPHGLDRVPAPTRALLSDGGVEVIVRTMHHPAAQQLSEIREVASCDDLYESHDTFDDVYDEIVARVETAAATGPVVYAVPGSPRVGEFAVRRLAERGDVEILDAESFVDAILEIQAYDPLDRGLQILNGHDLPDPLVLDKPTIVAHLDRPEVLADVSARLDAALQPGSTVEVVIDAGSPEVTRIVCSPSEIEPRWAGLRTSLFVDGEPGGIVGAINVMRRLREECPWDREQTHQSLVKNLVEESYELIEAISKLAREEADWVGYARVEDELGDVLLQVLFHSVIGRGIGAFDIDSVASVMTDKLVRRHPHVFGDVEVSGPEEVKSNWDQIKAEERGEGPGSSVLDGVPDGMPALARSAKLQNRAAKVGFDWDVVDDVVAKLAEELEEVREAIAGSGDIESELGDLLFSAVNLARHVAVDPELALRGAVSRFERRFRAMEKMQALEGLGIEELDRLWDAAKAAEGHDGS